METVTSSADQAIREKAIDFLSEKYERVETVPREVFDRVPLIDPEIVFKIQDKKVALLIEKKVRTPRWISIVGKNVDVLEKFGFEIGILALCEDSQSLVLPDYTDINSAFLAKNFGLYLVRNNELTCVCHRNLANLCERLTRDEIKPFFERLDQNKHIPNIVTQRMRDLKQSFLSDTLKDIAVEYDASTFEEPRKEYDFIQKAMEDILKRGELTDLKQTLNFLRLTENQLRSKGKRDHFLHSFQVFLIGEIIMDYNMDAFSAGFSNSDSDNISLERAWLMASILHDIGFPFQNREWIEGIGDYEIDLMTDTRNKHFIDDLISYFSRTAGDSSEDKVRKILYNRAVQKNEMGQSAINHGLISAIQLLRKTMRVPSQIYEKEVLPAAFSMAVHDREIWNDLVSQKLAPIDMNRFPVTCLLILCDHLQGWGRPGRESDPKGRDIILTNLDADVGNVDAKIWFNDIPDALLFRWETQEILDLMIATKDLIKVTVNQFLSAK